MQGSPLFPYHNVVKSSALPVTVKVPLTLCCAYCPTVPSRGAPLVPSIVILGQSAMLNAYKRHTLFMRTAGKILQLVARLRMRSAGPPSAVNRGVSPGSAERPEVWG